MSNSVTTMTTTHTFKKLTDTLTLTSHVEGKTRISHGNGISHTSIVLSDREVEEVIGFLEDVIEMRSKL